MSIKLETICKTILIIALKSYLSNSSIIHARVLDLMSIIIQGELNLAGCNARSPSVSSLADSHIKKRLSIKKFFYFSMIGLYPIS